MERDGLYNTDTRGHADEIQSEGTQASTSRHQDHAEHDALAETSVIHDWAQLALLERESPRIADKKAPSLPPSDEAQQMIQDAHDKITRKMSNCSKYARELTTLGATPASKTSIAAALDLVSTLEHDKYQALSRTLSDDGYHRCADQTSFARHRGTIQQVRRVRD